jgi:drug/metabolite transporter (DMT)-like permease
MAETREDGRPHRAGAFDIRTFIAMLIGIYGVALVLMGLFGTDDAELARADDLNINLWAGIGMVVVAALFQAWAMLRPIVVPPHVEDERPQAEDRPVRPEP